MGTVQNFLQSLGISAKQGWRKMEVEREWASLNAPSPLDLWLHPGSAWCRSQGLGSMDRKSLNQGCLRLRWSMVILLSLPQRVLWRPLLCCVPPSSAPSYNINAWGCTGPFFSSNSQTSVCMRTTRRSSSNAESSLVTKGSWEMFFSVSYIMKPSFLHDQQQTSRIQT